MAGKIEGMGRAMHGQRFADVLHGRKAWELFDVGCGLLCVGGARLWSIAVHACRTCREVEGEGRCFCLHGLVTWRLLEHMERAAAAWATLACTKGNHAGAEGEIHVIVSWA